MAYHSDDNHCCPFHSSNKVFIDHHLFHTINNVTLNLPHGQIYWENGCKALLVREISCLFFERENDKLM